MLTLNDISCRLQDKFRCGRKRTSSGQLLCETHRVKPFQANVQHLEEALSKKRWTKQEQSRFDGVLFEQGIYSYSTFRLFHSIEHFCPEVHVITCALNFDKPASKSVPLNQSENQLDLYLVYLFWSGLGYCFCLF